MAVAVRDPVGPLPEVFPHASHKPIGGGVGPSTTQLVALAELQLSVALLPETMVVGEMEMEAVGVVGVDLV